MINTTFNDSPGEINSHQFLPQRKHNTYYKDQLLNTVLGKQSLFVEYT